MTALAASDSPQLYVPADRDYAWFTMPMLLWWLALITVAIVGALIALNRFGSRAADTIDDHGDRLASIEADVRAAKADLDRLYDNAHWHPEDDEQPPTEPAAVSAGRHAAPEGDQ